MSVSLVERSSRASVNGASGAGRRLEEANAPGKQARTTNERWVECSPGAKTAKGQQAQPQEEEEIKTSDNT